MNKPTKTLATISKIVDYPGNVKHFELQLNEPMNFKAGQFLNLSFKRDDTMYRRPYSICSPPSEQMVSLCIKLVPEGHLTPVLWNLKEGDEVEVMGGLGLFTLDNITKNKILFVGTGTGIAPLRSMIFHLLEENTTKEIELVYGARYPGHHTYEKEFEELEKKYPNFKFTPVVSRPDENWIGRQGYVQQNLNALDTQDSQAFICGLPEMVDAVKEELFLQGMSEQDIVVEKY